MSSVRALSLSRPQAIRHCKHGHWYVDVHMATAQVTWPLFNSLQGFWPGMQMLLGDLDDAAQTIRAFHTLWVHIGYHPEGFNLATMQVQQGQKGRARSLAAAAAERALRSVGDWGACARRERGQTRAEVEG